jgi:hypothetical protein
MLVHDTNVASALPCRVLGPVCDAQESNGTARGGEGDECVICLYEMMETEEVTDFIPCGHTYPSPHPSRFMAMALPLVLAMALPFMAMASLLFLAMALPLSSLSDDGTPLYDQVSPTMRRRMAPEQTKRDEGWLLSGV